MHSVLVSAVDYARAPMMAGIICCEHCSFLRFDPDPTFKYGACIKLQGSVRPESKACNLFEPHASLIEGDA